MKAIILTRYGDPSRVLKPTEVEQPVPSSGEVLINVYATAINDYDWAIATGTPYLYRLMFGWPRPRIRIPGMELSGIVEAVGDSVTTLKKGDEVYGDISGSGFGSFAAYVCAAESCFVKKPAGMTFEEAASISHASCLAYQGLVDLGKLRQNQTVLINGAGGGVGTFGFQIAKSFNAEVTGVDTGEKLNDMRELGFDRVIDYKKTDFAKMGIAYDLILDAKTNRPPSAYLRCLKPKGRYVTVGGSLNRLMQLLLSKPLVSMFSKKSLGILALKPNRGLDYMHRMHEAGKLSFIIDGPHTLEEIPGLVNYFGLGKHKGKIIVSMSNQTKGKH